KFDCKEVVIASVDQKNNEIIEKKEVKLNKIIPLERTILSTQNADGSWDTPSESAFNIWILWQFKEIYETKINESLEWLKKVRINKDKCWKEPYSDSDRCSLRETSKVLAYLKLAGFDEALRIVHDGQAWLNTKQNFEIDKTWTLYVTSSRETNCTYEYDTTSKFDIEEDGEEEFSIDPIYRSQINLSCEDNVWMLITQNDGKVVADVFDDELRFFIDGGCWDEDNWKGCDYKSSLYATIATLDENRKEAGQQYLESLLVDHEILGKYLPSDERIIDSAIYLQYIDYNPSVRSFLVFSQNNDGSWGNKSEDYVKNTLYTALTFADKDFKPQEESYEDAREWVMKNTPFNGWYDIEKDALTYFLLKDEIPQFLSTSPKVLFFNNTSEKKIELNNPTHYNFTDIGINISEEIKSFFLFEDEINVSAQETIEIEVTQQNKKDGLFFGFINLSDNSEILKRVPVIIQNNPKIDIRYPKEVYVINSTKKIDFVVDKSASEFICNIISDQDILFLNTPKLTNHKSLSVSIELPLAQRKTIDYKGNLVCKSELITKEFPINMTIHQYEEFPVKISENIFLEKRGEVPKIELENLIDEEIDVSIKFETPESFYTVEENRIVLGPYENKKIRVVNDVPLGINYTVENKILFEALDHEVSIDFEAELNDKDTSKPGAMGIVMKILLWIVGLVIVGGAGFVGYIVLSAKLRDKKNKNKKQKVEEDEKNNAKNSETTNQNNLNQDKLDPETIELIRVIDQLNKKLSKDDSAMITKLKEKGFTDDKIKYAMNIIRSGSN
ncbi:MAG: hypothetical protein ACOC2U_02245, partial [bacterium]